MIDDMYEWYHNIKIQYYLKEFGCEKLRTKDDKRVNRNNTISARSVDAVVGRQHKEEREQD